MSVTIRASRQVASGLDTFFEAAADGDEAAALLTAVMQAVFTVAISGRVSFELLIHVGIGAHT